MEGYSNTQVHSLIDNLSKHYLPYGFEFYPFLTSWYNSKVTSVFELPYNPDTLAILAVSTPCMFENTFLPFLKNKPDPSNTRDPLDQAIINKLQDINTILPDELKNIIILYDFELQPNRAPKILMQTAGHISGAAYYYQRSDVPADTWSEGDNIYGVSMHPKYGGWFAFRAVIIIEHAIAPDLLPREPVDCVKASDRRIELLNRFNKNWKDWTYRDMVDSIERYSEDQKLYFGTLPSERGEVIKKILVSRNERASS
ncbi:Methylmalonic aciduria and homocystinuria type C protein-like [Oopsacas minuta]|uniref:Cyanocobalamin reductase (cyanide-eliminating) n=1 Tax=Oopsacas minuta TaxID=111878 RepID=A0AAV7KG39_9METZ|nr:Methylmalonic aciduria and homocystinuria type C protein-like [Oopsacas minuta]